jgi:hypothetical protein
MATDSPVPERLPWSNSLPHARPTRSSWVATIPYDALPRDPPPGKSAGGTRYRARVVGAPRYGPGAAGRPGAVWSGVCVVLLLALGALLAVYGAFLTPDGPRTGGSLVLSLGVGVGVVGNALAGWLAVRASGSRALASVFLLAWLVVGVVLATTRSTGSLILTGGSQSLATELFLLLGLFSGILAVRVTPPGGRAGGGRPARAPSGPVWRR